MANTFGRIGSVHPRSSTSRHGLQSSLMLGWGRIMPFESHTLPPELVDAVKSKLDSLVASATAVGDPPFAAILYESDAVLNPSSFVQIAEAAAAVHTLHDHIAHAEMIVLRSERRRLYDVRYAPMKGAPIPVFHLFVSAEPCTMCIATIFKCQIDHVYCLPTPSAATMIPCIKAIEVADRSNEQIERLGLSRGTLQMHYLIPQGSSAIEPSTIML